MMRWVLVAAVLMGVAANAATLSVRIEKLDPKGGTLHVALYDRARWPDDNAEPIAGAILPAQPPAMTVTLRDVAPGEYGVKVYQDANNNDKFDQNIIGYPLERFGFSRDAVPFLSAPGFERTKFTVKPGDNAIVIHLQ